MTESRSVVAGGKAGRVAQWGRRLLAKGMQELCRVMEMFAITVMGMSYVKVYMFKNSPNCILKISKCITCRLFLNEAD